ncbi:MAG TPA: site-2 protease family protein [Nocardioidaceae bacterium]|nr:site-2 protease family protein [Nocardioidaceae bacterium]
MSDVLLYTLAVVLFALGVIASIGLHEVGHMLPAKKFGVKVTQYFVGFGKTLWSTKRGETEYGVKMFPLGGFVKLVGMLPPEKGGDPTRLRKSNTGMFTQLISDARAAEYEHVQPGDEERLFYRKPWWQKLIVMSGGPLVNVVLAFLILGGVWMGFGVTQARPVVDDVSLCVISAEEAATDPNRTCTLSDPFSPAAKAGLQEGDRIVSFNGERVGSWDELTGLIRGNAAGEASIGILRDGEPMTLTTNTMVSPRPDLDNVDEFVEVGFLGVTPKVATVHPGPGYVVTEMWRLTTVTGEALLHIPEKMVGVFQAAFGGAEREADSPVSVVGASRVAGELATTDQLTTDNKLAAMLSLLGMVNLFVALFNFIPLLPLDGGHIAGALWEAVRRGFARLTGRPDPGYVDVAKLLPVAYVMAGALLVMGVLLIYADFVNPIRLGL